LAALTVVDQRPGVGYLLLRGFALAPEFHASAYKGPVFTDLPAMMQNLPILKRAGARA
jgi:hypothetical protein